MKQICICMAICVAGMALHAQEQGWNAGLYGMAGQAKFTYSDAATDYLNKGACQLGVFGQYILNGRIGWRVGLGFAYASGGYKAVEGGIDYPGFPPVPGTPYEVRFRHTQVAIPLEMLVDLSKKPGGFYLLFGPALRIRLHQEGIKTTELQGSGEIFTKDFSGEITNPGVDLYGSLGMGYAFSLGSRFRLFVQPMLTTNVGGEVLATLRGRKWQAGYATVYEFGVQLGVAREF